MFMHFTYTVPHGPLLGQQETTSVRFIGFMKCVSGTIVREMLHYNSVASLKPCFQCLSTFNLLSIIKGIVMHNLQSPLPPPSNCLNCLSRNIKLYLLGIHFAKIHIKLLNQFHQGKKKKKKTVRKIKDHCISAADYINHFWTLMINQNTHMPLIFSASGGALLLNKYQESVLTGQNSTTRELYQANVPLYPTELFVMMAMLHACTGMAVATATCAYWSPEVWLVP